MFKRFQVADLFHGGNDKKEVKEWIPYDAPDKDGNYVMPKGRIGIYRVKLKNGDETSAYYTDDKCVSLIRHYDIEPSHWWSKEDKTPLYDVTHWGKHD
jgi:hypothetical protein